jgi:hypothetical protein
MVQLSLAVNFKNMKVRNSEPSLKPRSEIPVKNATIQQQMTIALCRAISGDMSKLSESLLPVPALAIASSVLFAARFPALFSLSAARQARAKCSKARANTVKARDHGNSLEGGGHCRASHMAQTRKETIPTLNRTSTFFRDNKCSPIFSRAPSNF